METHTRQEVAQWMMEEMEREGTLYQPAAVADIAEKFGDEFTYINENGYPAIGKKVLVAFRKLSKNSVVWEKQDKCWRLRKAGDSPARQQG